MTLNFIAQVSTIYAMILIGCCNKGHCRQSASTARKVNNNRVNHARVPIDVTPTANTRYNMEAHL